MRLSRLIVALVLLSKIVCAAENPRAVGDAAGRLAVAQIYCDGRVTKKGRALFAEMRKQEPQTFAQGVLEAMARAYVIGMDACTGVATRFGKTGIDYPGLWRPNER